MTLKNLIKYLILLFLFVIIYVLYVPQKTAYAFEFNTIIFENLQFHNLVSQVISLVTPGDTLETFTIKFEAFATKYYPKNSVIFHGLDAQKLLKSYGELSLIFDYALQKILQNNESNIELIDTYNNIIKEISFQQNMSYAFVIGCFIVGSLLLFIYVNR